MWWEVKKCNRKRGEEAEEGGREGGRSETSSAAALTLSRTRTHARASSSAHQINGTVPPRHFQNFCRSSAPPPPTTRQQPKVHVGVANDQTNSFVCVRREGVWRRARESEGVSVRE